MSKNKPTTKDVEEMKAKFKDAGLEITDKTEAIYEGLSSDSKAFYDECLRRMYLYGRVWPLPREG